MPARLFSNTNEQVCSTNKHFLALGSWNIGETGGGGWGGDGIGKKLNSE